MNETPIEDAPVRVIFRTYRSDGSVLAVFPDIPADDRGHLLSYQHIGQHGAASWGYVQAYTRPATPEEYAPLKRELEGGAVPVSAEGPPAPVARCV